VFTNTAILVENRYRTLIIGKACSSGRTKQLLEVRSEKGYVGVLLKVYEIYPFDFMGYISSLAAIIDVPWR
jgi:hypothetical protein